MTNDLDRVASPLEHRHQKLKLLGIAAWIDFNWCGSARIDFVGIASQNEIWIGADRIVGSNLG